MPDARLQGSERNDDPAHIAAVAKMAEKRGCDWPGHPCGRDIPEFNGRDGMCLCESLVVHGASGDVCNDCMHFEEDCICWYLAEVAAGERDDPDA